MKSIKKISIFCLSVVFLVMISVFGTTAFLTSSDTDVNTFTIGQVGIHLDETKTAPDGTPVPGADRVLSNTYHILPGRTYSEDPTITVEPNSLESYVRILFTVHNASVVQDIIANTGITGFSAVLGGWDPDTWLYMGSHTDESANTISFEFRYKETVSAGSEPVTLPALFQSFTVPGTVTNEELKALYDGNFKLTFFGHAIQASGFETADAAWESFPQQMRP